VRRWRLFTVFPVGRAAKEEELQLDNEQFRRLMNFIIDTRREGRIRVDYGCEGFLGSYEGKVRDRLYSCSAGITVGSVLVDGAISACPSIRADYHQGNIYTDDFWDVWNNRFEAYRNREWMRTGECAECKMFRYCKGNGMHLRNERGELLVCHLNRLK
jgi:radical SAM protein with 4Fe4S-binding SPASM domain